MRQVIVENEQSSAKDSTQVIALFDRMMKQDIDDPQIPMLYSQYLLSKNMEQEAVPVLEQVVDLDPTNKAARLMLVSAAVKKEDYKQIIKVCEPGIEATPDALELYYYLAIAYHQAEQTDSVLSVCSRALEHVTADTRKKSFRISIQLWETFIIPRNRWRRLTLLTIRLWCTILPILAH